MRSGGLPGASPGAQTRLHSQAALTLDAQHLQRDSPFFLVSLMQDWALRWPRCVHMPHLFDYKQSREVGFHFPILFSREEGGLLTCPKTEVMLTGVWVGLQGSLLFLRITWPFNSQCFFLSFNLRASMVWVWGVDWNKGQDLLVGQLPEVKYEWFPRPSEIIVGRLRQEETMGGRVRIYLLTWTHHVVLKWQRS